MHNLPPKTRALLGLTLAAVSATALASVIWHPPTHHAPIWWGVLLLAAIFGEGLHVEGDDEIGDGTAFTFSVAVLVASAALFGPVPAALVAVVSMGLVDLVRGAPLIKLSFNAATYGLAGFWASAVFELAGGRLTSDLANVVPLVLLVGVHVLITTFLVGAVSGTARGTPILRACLVYASEAIPPQVMEFSLGLVLARLVDVAPLYAPLLLPLFVAVYRAHSRSVALQRETQHALRGLADMVDERDPYTRAHSERVGDHVGRLAEVLGLPERRVRALSRAGRLHDLGKLVVDTSILMKPARLTDAEFEQMRSHPAASSRLLSAFSFAREDSRLVELHHERYDGKGYYHVPPSRLPLEAHFLILADAWDAMTSDRPYRRGMSHEAAVAQIRKNLGGQFHPVLGRAFIAMMEERPVDQVLDPAQLRALRTSLSRDPERRPLPERGRRAVARLAEAQGRGRVLTAAGTALVIAGLLAPVALPAVVPLAAVAFAVAGVRFARRRRTTTRTLTGLTLLGDEGPLRLEALVDAVDAEYPMLWAGEVTGVGRSVLHRRDLWTSAAAPAASIEQIDAALRKLGTSLAPDERTVLETPGGWLVLFPTDRGWTGLLGERELPEPVVAAIEQHVARAHTAPALVAVSPAA